jgi:ParB family chromosome partitioning protein
MKTDKPTIEHLSIDALVPYARNSRTHSAEQIAQIAGSIKEFGFTNPVLIDADGGIIAGHGRVMAARKLGLTEVPCIRLGYLTETQKRAYVIADNKLALNAGWDEEMLRLELGELREAEVDLSLVGFTEEEIGVLLASPPDFAPGTEADQGKLDELAPKMVKCPTCNHVFNLRGHEQD